MMVHSGIKYDFNEKPWRYNGQSSWTFISLPRKISREIRDNFISEEKGWGRLNVTAKIGITLWQTAIWFDTKMNTYLLPLKKEVRKKENIEIEKNVKVSLWI